MKDSIGSYHCIGFDLPTVKETYAHFRDHLSLLRDYGDYCNGHCLHAWDDGWRRLYRCSVCGGLVLVQCSEFHGLDNDDYYMDYFPVDSEEEVERLNEQYSGFELERTWSGRRVFLNNDRLCGE